MSKSLRPENRTDLLLLLLYAPGKSGELNEPVSGITKLQKLMFLLQKNLGPSGLVEEARGYGFRPYKLGPFSEDLRSELDELESAGIVVSKRLEYWLPDDADDADGGDGDTRRVESFEFSLSESLGLQIGAELWEALSEKERNEFAEFKSFFSALSLRQLLIFTYRKFPDYTSESIIRERLGL